MKSSRNQLMNKHWKSIWKYEICMEKLIRNQRRWNQCFFYRLSNRKASPSLSVVARLTSTRTSQYIILLRWIVGPRKTIPHESQINIDIDMLLQYFFTYPMPGALVRWRSTTLYFEWNKFGRSCERFCQFIPVDLNFHKITFLTPDPRTTV